MYGHGCVMAMADDPVAVPAAPRDGGQTGRRAEGKCSGGHWSCCTTPHSPPPQSGKAAQPVVMAPAFFAMITRPCLVGLDEPEEPRFAMATAATPASALSHPTLSGTCLSQPVGIASDASITSTQSYYPASSRRMQQV